MIIQIQESAFHQKDLIELFPLGITLAAEAQRPYLLLREQKGDRTLPVPMNPVEVGVSLTQANPTQVPTSPHHFSKLLMESLAIKAKQCVFVEIKGTFMYVRIYFTGSPLATSVKLRADEAMSLCLYLELPFFATPEFIQTSREFTSQWEVWSQTQITRQNTNKSLIQ